MDTPELLAVAADWSAWEKPPRSSVRRRVQLPSALRPELALVVQGVRRCGKSTLLTQMIDRYQLDRRHCLFLNFEDPRLAGVLDHTTLQQLVAGFEARIGPQPATFFFDEIQRVDGWQRWLRMQLDLPRGHRFVVTGSNAHLLSGELASQLTGRHLRAELQPFDFDEFRAMRPGDSVEDYLAFGGFPAAVQSDERDQLLRTYFDDIVERDIRERVGARSSRSLRQLVQMLFESAGAELSVRRISAALDLSTDTTSLYLDAVANAYLAFPCPFFAWSTRKQALRNKKWCPDRHRPAPSRDRAHRRGSRQAARVRHVPAVAPALPERRLLARQRRGRLRRRARRQADPSASEPRRTRRAAPSRPRRILCHASTVGGGRFRRPASLRRWHPQLPGQPHS